MELLSIFETIVTYIYIPVAIVMILVILLQSGKGGMGTALGGGASQSVFGGGGASQFMERLTQGFAIAFMLCVLFLAYASAHSGSSRLQQSSDDDKLLVAENDGGEVNWERVGPNPLVLPEPNAAPRELPPPSEPAEETAPSPTEAESADADADADADTPAPSVDGEAAVEEAEAPSEGEEPALEAAPSDSPA